MIILLIIDNLQFSTFQDGLEIKNSPSLPAVGEPVIFVMAAAAGSTDTSTDVSE